MDGARTGILAGGMSDASLVFSDGLERPLGDALSIGRGPDNDLVLITKTVSRSHALLASRNGRWFVEDLGSFNGTLVNGRRIAPGAAIPLRDGDRLDVGAQSMVFSQPALDDDPDRTETAAPVPVGRALSPLQHQVVAALAGIWEARGGDETLPSNEEIAAELGTPGAVGTVKAALRRAYVKAGVADLPPHAKRRALVRVARERGWV